MYGPALIFLAWNTAIKSMLIMIIIMFSTTFIGMCHDEICRSRIPSNSKVHPVGRKRCRHINGRTLKTGQRNEERKPSRLRVRTGAAIGVNNLNRWIRFGNESAYGVIQVVHTLSLYDESTKK